MDKMAYRKAAATHVLGHNSLILTHMYVALTKKGSSLIVEHSLGVWIVHIRRIVFESLLVEKKKKERKKERRRRTKQCSL